MAKVNKIEEVEVGKLNPYKNNAKIHSKVQVEKIADSIKEFGFLSPCLIDMEYNLIAGHGRVEAAKKIGMKTVPCLFVEGLSEAQYKAYVLADNRLTELGEWDLNIVADELQELDAMDFDVSLTGFDMDDFVFEDEPEVVEDELPDQVETRCKKGDIWKLGRHKLLCGDSTCITDYEKLLGDELCDLVLVDPPYGMKKENEGVANDNLNFNDLLDFNRQWVPLTFSFLKDNGSWYCWGIDEPLMDIYSNILRPMQDENKITFRNIITWDKGNAQGMLSELFRKYPVATEKCLFVMAGVQGFNNNSDNYYEGWEPVRKYMEDELKKTGWTSKDVDRITGVTTVSRHCFKKSQFELITKENYIKLQNAAKDDAFKRDYDAFKRDYDAIKRDYDAIKRDYYSTRAYFDNTHEKMTDVWAFGRTSQEERFTTGGHATPKPLALCERIIKTSCKTNGSVLDVFGGSGSTLIASEQLNRQCRMIELEPKWCDVIIQRWENLTGLKAELVEG